MYQTVDSERLVHNTRNVPLCGGAPCDSRWNRLEFYSTRHVAGLNFFWAHFSTCSVRYCNYYKETKVSIEPASSSVVHNATFVLNTV